MTAQFEALPVGRGDAFFLQDGEYSFLFDGGEFKNQASTFLSNRGVSKLNAVICSHNDSDHANGIIGVLESQIHVDEVWIPVSWSHFINTAAQKEFWPFILLDEFCRSASFENYALLDNPDNKENGFSESNIKNLIKNLSEIQKQNKITGLKLNPYASSVMKTDISEFFNFLFAGYRIIQIINKSLRKKCKIRMFEFLQNGNPNSIPINSFYWIPINCQEITHFQSLNFSISEILYLTITNIESLVFKYENPDNYSIIFCADSDFRFQNTNLVLNIPTIATAPHHGSSDNCDVYNKLQGTNLRWVRSDSRCKSRPCYEFKQLKSRYCTICNYGTLIKQPISFNWQNGNWIPAPSVRSCKCK